MSSKGIKEELKIGNDQDHLHSKQMRQFRWRPQYHSRPPEPTFSYKLVTEQLEPSAFEGYGKISIEDVYNEPVHADPSLGIGVGFYIDVLQKNSGNSVMKDNDPGDKPLLVDAEDGNSASGKRRVSKNVKWLRDTIYLGTDGVGTYGSGATPRGNKSRDRSKKSARQHAEESFEDIQGEPVHPTDTSRQPTRVIDIVIGEKGFSRDLAEVVIPDGIVPTSSSRNEGELNEGEDSEFSRHGIIVQFKGENSNVELPSARFLVKTQSLEDGDELFEDVGQVRNRSVTNSSAAPRNGTLMQWRSNEIESIGQDSTERYILEIDDNADMAYLMPIRLRHRLKRHMSVKEQQTAPFKKVRVEARGPSVQEVAAMQSRRSEIEEEEI